MTSRIRHILLLLAATLVLVALTFPRIDLVTDIGVDNSLAWAFNHFYSTGLAQADHLVFPHGPLAFLMYPQALGGDLGAAFTAILLILGTFIFAMLSLGADVDRERFGWHLFIAAILATLVQVQMQLIGITALGLVLHWRTGSKAWLATAVLAALIGVHVRAGVGIMACTLLVAHAIMLWWKRGDRRTVLFTLLAFILAAVLLRLFLYGGLSGIGTYYYGLFELARASSAATGLYPHNAWLPLLAAILLFLIIPFQASHGPVRKLYALFGLTLFAAWKHGITREDIYHARGLFVFLILFFGIVLLAWRRPRSLTLLTMAAVLVFSYRALSPSLLYGDFVITPFGVNRLHDWAFDQEAMGQQARQASQEKLKAVKLPTPLAERLRIGTVDVFPWEFSYIPANDLEWRPRPVLQSYASYTPWLDGRNAAHFSNGEGAARILWHFVTDRWGGHLGSVDDRYVLNDEPRSIIAMLDRYRWTAGNGQVAILERTEDHRLGEPEIIANTTTRWNEWLEVPKTADGILRAKVDVKGTLYRRIKDFMYKDALYAITYQMEDGSMRQFRIVPDLAATGIWVAPFIEHPEHELTEQAVVAIRFTCSDAWMVKDEIPIAWELTPLATGPQAPATAYALFGKTVDHRQLAAQGSTFDSETAVANWEWNDAMRTDSLAHSGKFAHRIKPQSYSPTYVHHLDSLVGQVSVSASAWIRIPRGAEVTLAISVDGPEGSLFWEAVDARSMLTGANEWSRIALQRTVPSGPGTLLKVYLWNDDARPMLVDDINVQLSPAGH